MNHRNARLTPAGRRILVERIESGRPAAHVAKEMGVSRTCAYRWLSRYREHGGEGLEDRSSKPRSSPGATAPEAAAEVLRLRAEHREGPSDLGARCGLHPRTVSRILARAGVPKLWELDPVTGERVRAGRATGRRYEREAPGDLLHVDVKKLGRIPDGGGWRALGREATVATSTRRNGSASTMCTSPSMTIPGWPTPRFSMTRKAPPAPDSWSGRPRSWQPTGHRSGGS
jgi:transposase-like protein